MQRCAAFSTASDDRVYVLRISVLRPCWMLWLQVQERFDVDIKPLPEEIDASTYMSTA